MKTKSEGRKIIKGKSIEEHVITLRAQLAACERQRYETEKAFNEAISRNAEMRATLSNRGISIRHLLRSRDELIVALEAIDRLIASAERKRKK